MTIAEMEVRVQAFMNELKMTNWGRCPNFHIRRLNVWKNGFLASAINMRDEGG